MIEMRDGRKPVISPQLKSVSNYIDVSLDDIREACEAAFKNHSKKNDVVNFKVIIYQFTPVHFDASPFLPT